MTIDYTQFVVSNNPVRDWEIRSKAHGKGTPHVIVIASDVQAAFHDLMIDYKAEIAYEREGHLPILRLEDGRFCFINNDPTKLRWLQDDTTEVWNWSLNSQLISKEAVEMEQWVEEFKEARHDRFTKAVQEGSGW